MQKSNIGQTGVESIRIGGNTIDNLPIAEAAITKQQMPAIHEADQKNRLGNIIAKYPKQSVAWCNGAIKEADQNIDRVRKLSAEQEAMINEYSGHISLCKHRDDEIANLDADKDADEIKALKLKFPPYNVEAMQKQISQCKEAIVNSNKVIDAEYKSISEIRELMAQCIERDTLLKPYGI